MTHDETFTKQDLLNLVPKHEHFVGIDSDGCVVDTMEIKQKKCFHTRMISQWGLETIEPALRETAEFVNLYSKWRGQNRFIALVKTFDLLREHPDAVAAGIAVPRLPALQAFIDSGVPLGNPSLSAAVQASGDEELATCLNWSTDVNADIAATVKNVPPYEGVRESLEKIAQHADAICVSQTPNEALVREWNEHDLRRYVCAIAGQELGTKAEHLQMAAGGKYPAARIMMIGDAPGDRRAAAEVGACFYPIVPGREETSWHRFHTESFDRFLDGTYAGDYEDALIDEFDASLPSTPPWER